MQLPDQPPYDHGKILDHGAGIGEVTRAEIEDRARELAQIDGLDANQVNEGHRFQARRELQGDTSADGANDEAAVGELVQEDDVLGESGFAVPPATNAAIHGDEQTIGEELYGEGVTEADHDRMVESRRQERLDQ